MKTIDRLDLFIKNQGLSYLSFEKKIAVSNGYIRGQIKKQGTVSTDVLERIFEAFPDLSPSWLTTGQGEMLQKAYAHPTLDPPKVADPAVLYEVIKNKDKEIDLLNKIVETKEKLIEQYEQELDKLKSE